MESDSKLKISAKGLEGLTDEELAAAKTAVSAELERRRPKVDLSAIKPGMSKEDRQRAWADVRKAQGV